MAISNKLKVFQYQNKQYQFSSYDFDRCLRNEKTKRKVTFKALIEEISNKANVSEEAVRNWRFARNGPSELEMVERIREVLGYEDITILLKEYEGEETMARLTDREKEALKRVYDSIIEFLYEFIDSDGFDIVLDDIKNTGILGGYGDFYDEVAEKAKNVYRTLDKEFFDLGRHEVYGELSEYISDYIYEMFDGKITFAEGYPSIVERTITVDEEYERAVSAINKLIEKYI